MEKSVLEKNKIAQRIKYLEGKLRDYPEDSISALELGRL